MLKTANLLSFGFFGASKSVVFFAPLAILCLLGDGYYVATEQTFATALLVWPVFALGMTSAYSYFVLEKEDSNFQIFYYQYLYCLLVALGGICAISYFWLGLSHHLTHLALAVFLMLFSYFISTTYKCKNDVVRSSCLDAFPYFCFALFLLLVVQDKVLGLTIAIFVLALVFIVAYQFSKSAPSNHSVHLNTSDKRDYFVKGINSFIVSWIAIAVVMFSRVFTADFATLEESKELYLALRFATFAVLIYQFVQIKMYSHIFKISLRGMKKLLLLYWGAMTMMLVVILLSGAALAYYFAILYTAMWIMTSMLELQVVRKGVQMQVVKGVLFISPCLALFYFVDGFYEFLLFSIVLISVYLLAQAYALYEKRFILQVMLLPMLSTLGLLYYA